MKDFTSIPREIVDYTYTLEEIGALVILLESPNMHRDLSEKWDNTPQFKHILDNFLYRGIVRLDKNEKGDSVLHINLNSEVDQQETENMTINKALKELQKKWGIRSEIGEHVKELMEEIASSSYYTGYDDRRLEEDASVFTAYGKHEDFQ
jgi:hypothetical protein